jgi:hypothetical protein
MPNVPFYSENDLPLGNAPKAEVHARGLWHRSALLMGVRAARILVVTRGDDQSFAGRKDLLGGHESVHDTGLAATAAREANEELIVTREGKHVHIEAEQLRQVGEAGEMLVDTSANRERSTLFVLPLPRDSEIQVVDEGDDGVIRIRDHEFMAIGELESLYDADPTFAADGLGRVLARMARDAKFQREFSKLVESSTWTIFFACTYPGEPGCGCPASNFLGKHTFVGAYEMAEAEAKRISYEVYYGDFVWWIEKQEA